MNDEQLTGRWEQLKGQIRTEFGKLTDDDMEKIQGRKQHLIGRIRERYGDTLEAAHKKVDAVLKKLDDSLARS